MQSLPALSALSMAIRIVVGSFYLNLHSFLCPPLPLPLGQRRGVRQTIKGCQHNCYPHQDAPQAMADSCTVALPHD